MDEKIILITGGAGFIGSNLCKALSKKQRHSVFSLDNYSNSSKKNHVPGVVYIDGNTQDINKLIKFTPHTVYHLGEYSRVEQSFSAPELVWGSNMMGTNQVINFCKKADAKLVYAASSTVFTDEGEMNDLSPYTWTKAKNVEFIINYAKWYGLKYAITYFYNAYGPNEIEIGANATLIGIFKRLSQNNSALPVVSPGTQRRNFTHVDDIVDGLIRVGEDGLGDGYGIGSEESFSVIEVAKMFDCEINMLPHRRGNRNFSPLLVEKTKALGWSAKKTLPEFIASLKSEK